ncbi:MAG: ABC transporter substrate-binding protein [Betaproteobacteria bacterium]|nr:ABC transporter substrate-binding protein [Betaproteobacteria bacterium]
MATRQILGELAGQCASHLNCQLVVESLGGVEAAKRVRAGERFDLVFLADDALSSLETDGHLLPGSRRPLMRSEVVLAVSKGNPKPTINTEAAFRTVVCAAESIGYSTGPSGAALLALFERWGLLVELKSRLVLAPAGVPVAQLVTEGRAAIGFQQRSEFLGHSGIEVLGSLPESAAIETIFSGALGQGHSDDARIAKAQQILEFIASEQAANVICDYGMSPVTSSYH